MSFDVNELKYVHKTPLPATWGSPVTPANGRIECVPVGERTGARKLLVQISNVRLTVTNSSGAAFGSLDIWNFPVGNINITNFAARLNVLADGAGIPATQVIAFSVGTAATADTTLNGAEVNVAPSTNATLAASTVNFTLAQTAAAWANGLTTAPVLRINFAIASGLTGNGGLTLNGGLVLSYDALDVSQTAPLG